MSGRSRSKKQRTSNLVALGSAAVLAVYSAGFVRTRAAAARFSYEGPARRPSDTSVVKRAPAAVPRNNEAPRATNGASRAGVGVIDNTTAKLIPHSGVARATTSANANAGTATAKARNDSTPTAVAAAAAAPIAPTPVAPAAPRTDTVVQRAVTVAETPAAKANVGYTDGVFYGWGTSRHGDIQAEVEIKNGRIVSASIAQCLTRYSCSWIAALPAQVVSRQSTDVDYVSGATQSTDAYYYAVVDALLKAK